MVSDIISKIISHKQQSPRYDQFYQLLLLSLNNNINSRYCICLNAHMAMLLGFRAATNASRMHDIMLLLRSIGLYDEYIVKDDAVYLTWNCFIMFLQHINKRYQPYTYMIYQDIQQAIS